MCIRNESYTQKKVKYCPVVLTKTEKFRNLFLSLTGLNEQKNHTRLLSFRSRAHFSLVENLHNLRIVLTCFICTFSMNQAYSGLLNL